MISLHEYTIGLITHDALLRKSLPHIMHILGQDKIHFHTNLYEISRIFKNIDGPKILIFDIPEALKGIEVYQESLVNTFIFVLIYNEKGGHCSVKDCLETLGDLEKKIFEGHLLPSSSAEVSFPLAQEEIVDKKSYIFREPNPPVDFLTIYSIDKPLTMRGVVSSFEAVLPKQSVTTQTTAISHVLLENILKDRLKRYQENDDSSVDDSPTDSVKFTL